MSFGDSLKKALQMLKLDSKAITAVAKDSDRTKHAIYILILGGIAMAVQDFSIMTAFANAIGYIIGALIATFILHIIAKALGGKGQFMPLFRALSFIYIVLWPAVLPTVGTFLVGLLGLWSIVVEVVILKNVHKLSTGKAILTMLIPVVLVLLLTWFVPGLGFMGLQI